MCLIFFQYTLSLSRSMSQCWNNDRDMTSGWNQLAAGASRRVNFRENNVKTTRTQTKSSSATDVEPQPPEKSQQKGRRGIGSKEAQIVIVSAIVIILGTANRFLYKAQLSGPMSEHVFFLAQVTQGYYCCNCCCD